MPQNKMPIEAINAVKAAGFEVYMRDPNDSWLYFTEGNNIGYLQVGYSLTTVHIPSQTIGSGFQIERDLSLVELKRPTLAKAFYLVPDWVGNRDRALVKKWKDFAQFMSSNYFNAEYKKQ